MMNNYTEMNPNPLVQYLNKPSEEFTKADLIRYIEDHDIEMVNFRYAGWDGRLKELNFVINSKQHLDDLLTFGERVDGSSLFSFIEAGSSDMYVIPRYKTAFLNPFSEIPTIDILCSFYDKDGNPLASSPQYILKKAHDVLKERTGFCMQAMGELEYYIISETEDLFNATDQKGYHEAEPFSKWGSFRREAMLAIAQSGGIIKYGHSEVGNFTKDGYEYEQNEVEFLPDNIERAADQLLIAKWIIRTLAYKYGVTVTFAPKITVGKAGSGLHVHTKLVKDGVNAMMTKGKLNNNAKKLIAGFLDLASSITAFGNINPTSYFRLVPHQEAPTNICWGDRNRSVLVRVPLGWTGKNNMAQDANPLEIDFKTADAKERQTVEFRASDGSADIYLLMAGLAVAARHGLEMKDALKFAENNYVDVDIFKDAKTTEKLSQLPTSCYESALALEKHMAIYKKYDVFTEGTLKGIASYLKQFKDQHLRKEIKDNPEAIAKLVDQFFHCG
jgi:glutamine synthetase